MKLVPKLAVSAASFFLVLAAMDAKPTQAAILTYDFTLSSSTPGATGSGSFSFDDSALSSNGVVPVQSLKLQFNGDSHIYTEKNDIGYPTYPNVFSTTSLSSGSSIGLNYEFLNQANPANPTLFQITGDTVAIFSDASASNQIGSAQVAYAQVPEPATLSSIFLFSGIGLLRNRKRMDS